MENYHPDECLVNTALAPIIGKWKVLILLHIDYHTTLRFNELRRAIPDITQRVLTAHLRELEQEHLIKRRVFGEGRPKVEYSLSEHGQTLQPILRQLHAWGKAHHAYLEAQQQK
ncbi:winged helix-turn-helix transcriptional regulator [Shouchella clausii]|uniref:winged helix-turn-helix transcriptional regulator n=1 Tax=Shouchella clausii TaxID=79880 RepID=UPI000BA52C79|nr:helix-turn-helix domain-containing protein [Shouchella clausii]PAD17065.1 transcriptional regulator [Shouchella clausii]